MCMEDRGCPVETCLWQSLLAAAGRVCGSRGAQGTLRPREGIVLLAGRDPGCALGSVAGRVCRRIRSFAAGGEPAVPFPKWLLLSAMETDLTLEVVGSEKGSGFHRGSG